jgi:methylated-DNA-[protein]-cysteine S-methyltransferase
MGSIYLVFGEGVLRAVEFDDPRKSLPKPWNRRFGSIELILGTGVPEIVKRIDAYFAGDIHAIDTIPTETGGTPFQQSVWRELRNIPAGRTASYGDIARAIGNPKAVRAVGRANGANPISIVIPCHRVIGTSGHLVGYGGGLDRKTWLLEHESALPPKAARPRPRPEASNLFSGTP